MMFVLQIYRTLAKEYISHHPLMRGGHPNCTNHSQDVFENGVINAGSWKEHNGSMIVSHRLLYYTGCASMLICDKKDVLACVLHSNSPLEPDVEYS
jgi:hypothetical protein